MITLEDAAGLLSTDHDCCPGRGDIAALVRAAQAVIDAAEGIHVKSDRDGKPVIIGMLNLSEALAAFHEIEKGEKL